MPWLLAVGMPTDLVHIFFIDLTIWENEDGLYPIKESLLFIAFCKLDFPTQIAYWIFYIYEIGRLFVYCCNWFTLFGFIYDM